MTRRLLTAPLLVFAGLAGGTLIPTLGDGASAQLPHLPATQPPVVVDPAAIAPGVPHQVTMRVGDTMVAEEAGVGCQVVPRGRRVVVECRRAGALTGTYMTLIGDRRAKLARFRSDDTAKVIVTARHGGGWRACGMARAASAGGGGCR